MCARVRVYEYVYARVCMRVCVYVCVCVCVCVFTHVSYFFYSYSSGIMSRKPAANIQ